VPVLSQLEAHQLLQRGGAPSLVLIHGAERYLARRLLRAIRAKLEREGSVDYLEWNQDDGAAELCTALTTLPLGFGAAPGPDGAGRPVRRLVVAHNPGAALCLPYLGQTGDPSLALVLFFDTKLKANDKLCKAVADMGWVVECPPLKGRSLVAWAQGEARSRGKQLPGPAAEYLHFLCGDNPGLISQELDKAALFLGESQPQITAAVLRETAGHTASRSIFELVDAVACRKSEAAREILGSLLDEGQAPVYIASMLARHYLQMLEASLLERDGNHPRALAGLMGIHPYVAQKLHQQMASFPLPEIEEILSMMLGLDRSIKQGRGEPGLLLEAAVGQICSQKPPALQSGRSHS
jgi:DNA polymerase-3 subunit delta